jgi:class 3 adenylate cyclase/tetratricopeptide (TPR) repeat protein
VSKLRDWLARNQLEQLAELFEANDIDLDILPEMSERDFAELGVSLGNRRRLMKAIAERATEPAAARDAETPGAAERRQVTVLFCDLVGSTALSGAIDPELLGALIRRFQDAAAGAVARFDGFLAKFMGDGALAYFGFPHAHEDAAERAVRAALALMAEIGRIARPDGEPLTARIGIATGLVVVGEIVGAGLARERAIVGETPNLAARLQSLAAPGAILIAEATQQLLGGLFELDATGPHELKGFAKPVPVWRVLRETSAPSRFAAIRTAAAPFVGRANEVGLMLDRWRLARQGEGQIVTVTGEAGIGKSRIVQRLLEELAAEPQTQIHLQCSPYHRDSALYPILQHLGRAAGFAADDPPSARLDKLGVLFAERATRDANAIPLLADLLSIPGQAAPAMTPAQRKSATLALLVDEIVRLAEAAPVLLVLEDAHWSDATTLELTTRLADGIGSVRLLALVTARPEFAPPWQARPHATVLALGRLGRAECAQLVAGVAAAHGLSAETAAAIVAKTDGVPLFVEELTKSMMESAGEDGAAVPATLKDSLMARLDRLGEAREVAQTASVIGRQFGFALLEAIAPTGAATLEAALAKLIEAGIVFPQGRGQELGYSFKHALVRDAAYESLLLTRRREWHERIARALEARFPEVAANEPELLAHHFGEAGLADPACDYRMRAGDRAVSRSAYQEATAHFAAGLKSADALPESADRMRRQLDFLLKLGPALMVAQGMQSAEAEDVYRRAVEIAERLGDDAASYKAKWGLWLHANIGRRTALARDRANELVALAQRSNDDDLLLEAYHCRWSTAFFRGEVAAAIADSRFGIDSYDMTRHRHLGLIFGGHDPGVCAHVVATIALQLAGDTSRSMTAGARGLALAEALDHPNSIAHALTNIGIRHQIFGDRGSALETADRLKPLAEKYGLVPWRVGARLLTAWAIATGTGVGEAARLVDAEIAEAIAVSPLPQFYLGLGAEVLLAAGRPADALAHLDGAIAWVHEPGVGFYLPEIYRLRGQCLLALDRANKDAARAAFVIARDVAKRQGAIIFARRADAALAELG